MFRHRGAETCTSFILASKCIVQPGYNDIGLYDTSPVESDILW
jgi:hypothetical protein